MTYRQVDLLEVRAWGRTVGAVAPDAASGFYAFEYAPEWLRDGVELAPLHLPRRAGAFVFPELDPRTYYRLPAMLADALPDRFGNALVDRWLAEQGIVRERITSLDRLAYAADRAMGALEFYPPARPTDREPTAVQLADLVTAARATVSGRIDEEEQAHDALRQLIQVGTSAGGARAKAVVAYNPTTSQIRSGQLDAPTGFEHWLIKLDGVVGDPTREEVDLVDGEEYCRVEYAYYLMALECGIEMSECRLLPEGPRTHFLTRRFDRTSEGGRIHQQTLCAMAHLDFNQPRAHSYSQYLQAIEQLGLGADAREQAYRRMVFNVSAVNRDDHTKNVGFVLAEGGEWELAPAYDLTHSHNPDGRWTREHQMSVNGRNDAITVADLRAVGDRHLVPAHSKVVSEVLAVVARWAEFAEGAGLSELVRDRVAVDLGAHRPR